MKISRRHLFSGVTKQSRVTNLIADIAKRFSNMTRRDFIRTCAGAAASNVIPKSFFAVSDLDKPYIPRPTYASPRRLGVEGKPINEWFQCLKQLNIKEGLNSNDGYLRLVNPVAIVTDDILHYANLEETARQVVPFLIGKYKPAVEKMHVPLQVRLVRLDLKRELERTEEGARQYVVAAYRLLIQQELDSNHNINNPNDWREYVPTQKPLNLTNREVFALVEKLKQESPYERYKKVSNIWLIKNHLLSIEQWISTLKQIAECSPTVNDERETNIDQKTKNEGSSTDHKTEQIEDVLAKTSQTYNFNERLIIAYAYILAKERFICQEVSGNTLGELCFDLLELPESAKQLPYEKAYRYACEFNLVENYENYDNEL